MGKWDYRKGRVARRQDVCEKIGNPEDRPSRFAKVMRTILPCRWRRIGTDSIPVGTRIGTNDRALLGMQTTIPAGRE